MQKQHRSIREKSRGAENTWHRDSLDRAGGSAGAVARDINDAPSISGDRNLLAERLCSAIGNFRERDRVLPRTRVQMCSVESDERVLRALGVAEVPLQAGS